jgi:hypothetical protein
MPLSSIVLIVVRLFALSWLLQALALIASAIAVPLPRGHYAFAILIHYGPVVLLTILAIFLWILSPVVARFVSRGFDTAVNMGSLSRSDLYSFAFVFLGLFFILSSFADVINWIHYFAVAPEDLRHDPRIQNFYKLTRPCLTLAAGLVSLLGAPTWTKKVLSRDRKNGTA